MTTESKNKHVDEHDHDYVPGSVSSVVRKEVPVKSTAGDNASAYNSVRKIVFLGTSSAIPLPGRRNTSAICVMMSNGASVLLDCGEATQHQIMRRYGADRGDL